jgi:hypothetical protein
MIQRKIQNEKGFRKRLQTFKQIDIFFKQRIPTGDIEEEICY